MDYFDKTVYKNWDLSEALENAKINLGLSDEGALSYIRNKLNNYDNATAKHWKQNWSNMAKKLTKQPSGSTAPMNVNNYINAVSATNNNINSYISNTNSSNSNLSSKRKQPSDEQAQESNKKQFQLKNPFNDNETEATDAASETIDEESDNHAIDLLGPVVVKGVDISVALNTWIKKSKHVTKAEDQDLLRYLIIDNTTTSSSAVKQLMSKDIFKFLCQHNKASEFGVEHKVAVDFSKIATQGCRTISQLKQSLKSIQSQANNEATTALAILNTYAKQRVKNIHLISNENQTEQGFIIVYVAPIMKQLLEAEENIYFTWGETMLESQKNNRNKSKQDDDRRSSGARIDLKIDIMDEESNHIISNFCLLEVSGPPQVKCHAHFKRDKKRIAKSLKTILNSIYAKNPSQFESISKLVLYGVQVYDHQFFVYSLRLIKPKLYLFSLDSHFTYPSSGLELTNAADFIQSLLRMKNAILASLTDVLAYITTNNNPSSASTIKQNEIIADASLTPHRKN
ncbi:hypothetical protein MAM1_0013c01330 [Mucor ambiguus]|uniref:Uncharacterized protein n=1 Tax=Mucor ambiguus TaxID=91626 RepID=A0A0C9LR28_9FUNG|nr:hypothetical protein MAM1_0013c01330 [Mucor ambiguus]